MEVESQKVFAGFGEGQRPDEYFFSLNMHKSRFGIAPTASLVPSVDSGTLPTLGLFNWLVQIPISALQHLFGVDATGLFHSFDGSAWAEAYQSSKSNHGNGLITDQKNRLLYLQDQFVGMMDPTVSNYSTGTLLTQSGMPTLTGSGTSWDSSMVGKQIKLQGDPAFYTVASVADANHLDLTINYPNGSVGGLSYTIFMGWIDDWQDFGSAISPDTTLRPSDTYEDSVLMGSGNLVAELNVTDDSFTSDAFELPAGFNIRAIKSGRNGVLIGANFNNWNVLVLWDNFSDRSIAPWIWNTGVLQSIVRLDDGAWLAITDKQIIWTNGYQKQTLAIPPDYRLGQPGTFGCLPQGAELVGNYLFIGNNGDFNRNKNGLLALDITTYLWEFLIPTNLVQWNAVYGAILNDNVGNVYVSHTTENPGKQYVSNVSFSFSPMGYIIQGPFGIETDDEKTAEVVKLELGVDPADRNRTLLSYTASVKVANFKRQLWGFATQKTTATDFTSITVDGTINGHNDAEIGDEVTFLEGANAGVVAHITNITGRDSSTEVWTLNTTLANHTESGMQIAVSPFRLIDKQTITNAVELKEMVFNAKNKYRGKKYLIKVLFENIGDVAPELQATTLLYEDLNAL
jgi:hypothetical protein